MRSTLKDRFGQLADRERLLGNPKLFDTEVLGLEYPDHYEEADRVLDTCPFVLWNAPVGHGKSTKMAFARPVLEIARNRNIRILFGSRTLPLAGDHGKRIRNELTSNEKLIELCGEFKDPTMWSTTKFQVRGRTKNLTHRTVTMTGLKVSVEGVRVDIGILDDVIDIKSMTSEVERAESKTWFDTTFSRRLDPNARLWIVGTRWHPEDLYDHVIKKRRHDDPSKGRYHHLLHAAIIDEEEKKVLWPEMWPWDKLMEEKADLGAVLFEARYMNNPQAITGMLFKMEWLEFVDTVPDELTIYQGWDLAISEKETADYTVGCTVGVSADNEVYVLDMYREHVDFPTSMDVVKSVAKGRWRPRTIAIETNAYQLAAQQHLKKTTMLPVVESPAKGDKVARIQGVSPHFENGRIKIWREMRNLDVFVSEFVNFPNATHDDTLDALWHALQLAIKNAKYGVATWP